MKTNQNQAIARLKSLYDKKAENQIFAHMIVDLPADIDQDIKARASQLPPDALPSVDDIFDLWKQYLTFFDAVEDDRVPSIYPRQ
ncbi:MAG: hypothetical protein CMJ49_02590 [Planctomycetaceae bacterium]|nr:hypothetical protein [Planctomycetaceae bacterium]